jgi:hypothetical protein
MLLPFNKKGTREMNDLYLYLSKDQEIGFTAEFEMLTGEQRLAVLNRTMDLIMAKTGQVIDSLEVQ